MNVGSKHDSAENGQSTDLTSWVVSEPKTGTLTQCLGVAVHFDKDPVKKIVHEVHGIRKLFAPALFSKSEKAPDLIVSCGYRPEKKVMRMKKRYGGRPLAVHLQRPEVEGYDLCFVSRHDWTPELDARPGYHKVVGVPHRFTRDMIEDLRPAAVARYASEGKPIATVLLGGSNGAYLYDDKTLRTIGNTITDLVRDGWKVLVSTSRRSQPHILETVLGLKSDSVVVWDREGENPYVDYLAAADAFLIAKDSITMPCEALTTGRPVYALDLGQEPGAKLDKFERFHDDLQNVLKLTRAFNGRLDAYAYEPLAETARIAAIVRQALKANHA